MGLTIYLGAYFGKWLDGRSDSSGRTYTIVLTLLAVVVSLWSVHVQLKKINDQHD
jgi:membrane protein DedA with SNARE-associated domain